MARRVRSKSQPPNAPVSVSRRGRGRAKTPRRVAAAVAAAAAAALAVMLINLPPPAHYTPPVPPAPIFPAPASVPDEVTWAELQTLLGAASTVPRRPLLVRGSPQQRWLASQRSRRSTTQADAGGLWTPSTMLRLSQTRRAGADTPVALLSRPAVRQREDGGGGDGGGGDDDPPAAVFTRHDPELHQYATGPSHTSTVGSLRSALVRLWGDTVPNALPAHQRHQPDTWWSSPSQPLVHYVSASLEDLPPDFLPHHPERLLQFLPDGCLADDTRWAQVVAASHGQTSVTAKRCRGLTGEMWFGAAGVGLATHYDLQHNLFVNAGGEKRFTLLPASAHRALRLFPRWHGSQRQAQAHLPDVGTAAALASTPNTTAAAATADTPQAQHQQRRRRSGALGPYATVLGPGDALYLPPLWFHFVESLSPNVGANFWTDSLASDAWAVLTNASGTAAAKGGSGGGTYSSSGGSDDREAAAQRWRGQWAGLVDGFKLAGSADPAASASASSASASAAAAAAAAVAASSSSGNNNDDDDDDDRTGNGKHSEIVRLAAAARAVLTTLFALLEPPPAPQPAVDVDADSEAAQAAAAARALDAERREASGQRRLSSVAVGLLAQRYQSSSSGGGGGGGGGGSGGDAAAAAAGAAAAHWDPQVAAFRSPKVAQARHALSAACRAARSLPPGGAVGPGLSRDARAAVATYATALRSVGGEFYRSRHQGGADSSHHNDDDDEDDGSQELLLTEFVDAFSDWVSSAALTDALGSGGGGRASTPLPRGACAGTFLAMCLL